MFAVAHLKLVIIVGELKGRCHLTVGQRPIPEHVVQVVLAILEEDPDRLGVSHGSANQARIYVSTTDIGETADVAEHFAEQIGPLPSDRERADAATADATDAATRRVFSQVVGLGHLGEHLLLKEASILIGKGVVFEAPIGAWPL